MHFLGQNFPAQVGDYVCSFTLASRVIGVNGIILPESSRFAMNWSRIGQKSTIFIGGNHAG
ncbi:hypothetical protein TH25_20455 [Thalassospira profundimaris]|uniref:Uncharacterized protein n=1 Tax=Thalassospira profundimaris TaxID=502049 RepID=A0A367WRT6_9PROT|nr:hypothetical protein TH25_20455 [Thalassospira profundimaris]